MMRRQVDQLDPSAVEGRGRPCGGKRTSGRSLEQNIAKADIDLAALVLTFTGLHSQSQGARAAASTSLSRPSRQPRRWHGLRGRSRELQWGTKLTQEVPGALPAISGD